MHVLQHSVLQELSVAITRRNFNFTPAGAVRIQQSLIDLDNLHTFVTELGGLEVIRQAVEKTQKKK